MAKTLTAAEQEVLNWQLIAAAREGNMNAINQAIKDGADINARDEDKITSLHWAVRGRHIAAVITLLEAGAEIDIRNESDYTPLHWAAFNGDTATMDILIAFGADLAAEDKCGRTPISIARVYSSPELAKYLQSMVDNPAKRPVLADIGLDMSKRNAALKALATKLVVGEHTAKAVAGMEAQRQAALNDPSEGI